METKGKTVDKKGRIDWSEMGIMIALLVMCVLFSVCTRSFLSVNNIVNIFRQISIVGICAVGMTMIILTGGIDLSVGSLIGLAAVVGALMMSHGVPVILAVLIVLVLGVCIGFLNGVCINYLRNPTNDHDFGYDDQYTRCCVCYFRWYACIWCARKL